MSESQKSWSTAASDDVAKAVRWQSRHDLKRVGPGLLRQVARLVQDAEPANTFDWLLSTAHSLENGHLQLDDPR